MTKRSDKLQQKLLYPINSFSNVEYRKIIPFAICSKKIKCLGINLRKDGSELYSENYKPLEKEIEEERLQKVERPPMLIDW
jgi:hypothetical protein